MKIKLLVIVMSALMLTACTVPEVITQPNGTTVTNQVPDPRLTTGLGVATTVNTATGAAGVNPYAAVIGWALGAIAAGASWWAKLKTSRLLKVVVQGVEQSGSDPAKTAIATHSANAGVRLELDNVVQKIVSGNA